MHFHDFPFVCIQSARFEQHRIGCGNLADVVHGRGLFQYPGLIVAHARLNGNQTAHFSHAAHMIAGFVGAGLNHIAQAHDQLTLGIGDFLIQ